MSDKNWMWSNTVHIDMVRNTSQKFTVDKGWENYDFILLLIVNKNYKVKK
jgi:hypothetical protein